MMPESFTAAPDWLRAEVVTLAWCWRLARRDGVVIGLTSHDRDLLVGGLLYRAAPGMKPSALETSDSLDAETMDLEGAIASEAIAAPDLDAGRWDGAELELVVTDWIEPDAAPVTVARGSLGAIERRGAAFAAELQGVTRLLDRPVCPDRPNNLYDPLPGDWGARGRFGGRAAESSPQWWLTTHRGWVALAGAAAAGVAVALLSGNGRRLPGRRGA